MVSNKYFTGGLKPVSQRANLTLSSDVDQDTWMFLKPPLNADADISSKARCNFFYLIYSFRKTESQYKVSPQFAIMLYIHSWTIFTRGNSHDYFSTFEFELFTFDGF